MGITLFINRILRIKTEAAGSEVEYLNAGDEN
jgi:hypothetical protein